MIYLSLCKARFISKNNHIKTENSSHINFLTKNTSQELKCWYLSCIKVPNYIILWKYVYAYVWFMSKWILEIFQFEQSIHYVTNSALVLVVCPNFVVNYTLVVSNPSNFKSELI